MDSIHMKTSFGDLHDAILLSISNDAKRSTTLRFETDKGAAREVVLHIHARDLDGAVAGADRLEKTIPGARKVIIDNCGHMPQLERADEFNRLVREFLTAPKSSNQ